MKIHFSAPIRRRKSDIDAYKVIHQAMLSDGHEILNDWVVNNKIKSNNKRVSEEEWQNVVGDTLQAVSKADAIIVEATTPSFSMGYISALTLSLKKPLLILFEGKVTPYVMDMHNNLHRSMVYNDADELKNIVQAFLKDIDVDTKNLRFNMVLDRNTYNYLAWESANSGKTKAQIIRELIGSRMGS